MENELIRDLTFFKTKTFILKNDVKLDVTIRKTSSKEEGRESLSEVSQLFMSLSINGSPIAMYSKMFKQIDDKSYMVYLSSTLTNRETYNLVIDEFNILLDNFSDHKLSALKDFLSNIKEIHIVFK